MAETEMVENPAGGSDIDIHVDEETGRRYSVNNSTGETKWMDDDKEEEKKKKKSSRKKDTADESHQRTTTELPDGWTREVRDGRDYYANRKTKESSWKPPPGSTGGSAEKSTKKKSKKKEKAAGSLAKKGLAAAAKIRRASKAKAQLNKLANSGLGKQMKIAMGGGSSVGAMGAEGTSQAYSGNFSSTGIGLDRYGTGDKDDTNGKSESHRISHGLATAAQVASRQDPRVLAKKMFQKGERFHDSDNYALLCRSIEFEKSRVSPDGTLLDNPLEELPGRVIIFTNQRIMVVDSSYFEVDHGELHMETSGGGGCLCCKKKKVTTYSSSKEMTMGHLPNEIMYDLSDWKPARYQRTLEIGGGEHTTRGWDIPSRRSQAAESYPGGPSSTNGGLPLTMGDTQPGTTTTIDFAYFRSFHKTEVQDVRMDFISATRTVGHKLALKDERSMLDKVADACCKQGLHNCTNGLMMPFASSITLLITVLALASARPGLDSPEQPLIFGCVALFFNTILLWYWIVRKKVTETLEPSAESERQVRIKLEGQGSLIINVSYAHTTECIARTIAPLMLQENELGKFTKTAQQITTEAQAAVAKAGYDAVQKAQEDVKKLEEMLDSLRAQADRNKTQNVDVKIGKENRDRYPKFK